MNYGEMSIKASPDAPTRTQRSYRSRVREQKTADTRERIVRAGVEIVEGLSDLDWSAMTFQAVAEGAGVSKRTVFRHFATERNLHDAVMQRFQERAGVSYEHVDLAGVAAVARRVFEALSSFAVSSWTIKPDDPTFTAMDRARGDALRGAVATAAPDWSSQQQALAAGVLDVLWSPPAYERLVMHWGASSLDAIKAIEWAIGLVVHSVESGQPPR
ncbi:TetR/AcrR family transcriptional regulator [Mycobacterium sp.]|uniref:TetR/AcrR family transcriptional regulator n=1 Tax=Mycobacterium sp. TaxID=1785 RepID=UPI003F968ED2